MTPPCDFASFVGRRAVYIESGKFCVVRVEHVKASEKGLSASLCMDAPLVCNYREQPSRFSESEPPFGERWDIFKAWEWFYPDNLHWDGSPYMGFHLLFAGEVVSRFLKHDLGWMEDYF